jgi:hypothetical protein
MEWGAAIASLLGIVLWGLKQWQSNQPKRDQENAQDEIQQGRKDIANGDAAAVSDRIDSLLTRQGDPTGQPGSEVTAERIGSVLGVAGPAGGISPDTGKSGSLPS